MAFSRDESEGPVCPFVDLNDKRCASHFTLSRMDEAFDLCMRRHLHCVTYYQILQERRGASSELGIPNVRITIEGRSIAVRDPRKEPAVAATISCAPPELRATGS